jgi:hypothetical protein
MFRVLLFLSAFSVWGAAAQAATYTFTSNPYSFFTYRGDGPGESYQLRGPYSVTHRLTLGFQFDDPLGPNESRYIEGSSSGDTFFLSSFDGLNQINQDQFLITGGTLSTGPDAKIIAWSFGVSDGGNEFDSIVYLRSSTDPAGLPITEVGYFQEYRYLFDQSGAACNVTCVGAEEATATAIGGTWTVSPPLAPVPVSGSAAFLGSTFALGLLLAYRRRRSFAAMQA